MSASICQNCEPPAQRRRLMVTADGAGASHALITPLDALAARRGYQLVYSVGWELGERERAALRLVPEAAWQIGNHIRGFLVHNGVFMQGRASVS